MLKKSIKNQIQIYKTKRTHNQSEKQTQINPKLQIKKEKETKPK